MTYTKMIERLRAEPWAILHDAADIIEALHSKLGDAIQSSAHWQHQFTEVQAENERLDKENTDSLVSLATAIQHRDGFRKQLDYLRHEMDDLEEDYSNLQAERDALQSKLDAMGKGEPVAHVYAIERTGRPLVAWDDEKGVGLGDKLYAAPKVLAPEPDMFWNRDDPERQHDSIDEFLNDEMCKGQPVEVGAVYTIQQAKRLPNVQIKVTSICEESCEAEYEVLPAHGSGGTP